MAALAAVALTFFSLFRVGFSPNPHISFRHHETWQSAETLLVTQPGFGFPTSGPGPRREPSPYELRVSRLADVYAKLANTGVVRALALKSGPLNGRYEATPANQAQHRWLPFLNIKGQARSPARAAQIAARVSRALRAYLEQQQAAARIPRAERIQLTVLPALGKAALVQGRWRRGPLVALTVVIALLLLAAFSRFREEHR